MKDDCLMGNELGERIARLETSMDGLKDSLLDLKQEIKNGRRRAGIEKIIIAGFVSIVSSLLTFLIQHQLK